MATLFGSRIKNTWGDILKFDSGVVNAGATGALATISDGFGNSTPLQLSTTSVAITSIPTNDTDIATKLYVDKLSLQWTKIELLSTNTGAQNLALFDAGVIAAKSNGKRLFVTSDGGECEIAGTLSLSGHSMDTDGATNPSGVNGESGENGAGFVIWWDNVVLKIPATPTFSDFHECKSPSFERATVTGFSLVGSEYEATYANAADVVRLYEDGIENTNQGTPGALAAGEWGVSGTTVYIKDDPTAKTITVAAPQEGYKSVDFYTITDQAFGGEAEAPIIDGSDNPVPYACFWDQRGTGGGDAGPGTVHYGALTLKGNAGQDNKLVAIGASQKGYSGDDGKRCFWGCKIILEGWQVGIYGTPRFGSVVDNDGFVDCITRNVFSDIEMVECVRPFVLGANKADAAKFVGATLESSHTGWVQNTGISFNVLRINHRPATQAVPAIELDTASFVVTDKCYVRNNGETASVDGAAYFFRVCINSSLELSDLQFDNNDTRTGYGALIYVGESYNTRVGCPNARVFVTVNHKNKGRVDAITRVQADLGNRERQIISHGYIKESELTHVDFEGSSNTNDKIEIRQEDQWKIYKVTAGALEEVFNLYSPLDIIPSYNYNGTIAVAPISNATDSLAIGDGASATDFNTVAIGVEANCSIARTVAIGPQSTASGAAAVAIGRNATASGTESIAIGGDTNAGNFVQAIGNDAIAIGRQSYVGTGSTQSIAIGKEANVADGITGAVALGLNTNADAIDAVAIGNNADAFGDYSIAIGSTADTDAASGEGAIAIGWNADANGDNSIAIGSNNDSHLSARADHDKAIAVGNAKTRADGEIVHGIQGRGNASVTAQRNERTESTFILNQLSSAAGTVELYTTDNATSTGIIDLSANTGFAFEAIVYAQGVNAGGVSNGNSRAIWKFDYGLIVRNTGGSATLDIISPSGTGATPDSSLNDGSGWTIDIDATGTQLRFRFTTTEAYDIIVRAVVRGTFISFDPT